MHMLFQYKILGFLKEKYMCIPLTQISIVYNGNVLYLIIVHVYHMIYIHSQTCLNGHLYKKQRFIKTTFPSSLEWTLYTGFTVFDIRIVEELCLFMIMTRGGSRISIQGGALKKIRPSGGRRENVQGISCEKNHDFTPKNLIFSNFRGGGRTRCAPPPGSAIDDSTLMINNCINIKKNAINHLSPQIIKSVSNVNAK